MDYAPVSEVSSNYGRQLGSLVISNGNCVEWWRYGSVYRKYTLTHNVFACVFTRFSNDISNDEVWVCIASEDSVIHSYGTESGRHYVTGLSIIPTSIKACQSQGLVVTSQHNEVQRLFLLQSPESLPHAIVPSSLDVPLTSDQELAYFDNNVAVFWNDLEKMVTVYEVRMLHHRNLPRTTGSNINQSAIELILPTQLAATSIDIESFSKAAIISPVHQWSQKSIGTVFGQHLLLSEDSQSGDDRKNALKNRKKNDRNNNEENQAENEYGAANQLKTKSKIKPKLKSKPLSKSLSKSKSNDGYLVAVHDDVEDTLYILDNDIFLSTDGVTSVALVAGIYRFPGMFFIMNGELYFRLLSLPQISPLKVPLDGLDITNVSGSGSIKDDYSIVSLLSEPTENWIDVYFQDSSGNTHTSTLFLSADLDNVMTRCFDILFHVLGADETALLATEYLAQHVYIDDKWKAFCVAIETAIEEYDPNTVNALLLKFHLLSEELSLLMTDTKPLKAITEISQMSVNNFSELSIYVLLMSIIDQQRIYGYFPELIATNSDLFPALTLILSFFKVMVYNPENLQSFFDTENILQYNWSYGIKMCLLEITNYYAFTELKKADNVNLEGLSTKLFRTDLRLQEATKLLRIDEPQRCLFGALVNMEKLNESQIQLTKRAWSVQLLRRACFTAFGTAAIDLHTKVPFLWEQMKPQKFNSLAVCTETGITIKADHHPFDQGIEIYSSGTFAQGVSLGMSISPVSKKSGIDGLWILTSSELRSYNKLLFAGFVLGAGISGFLSNIEDWQFYESLIKSDKEGILAALLGLATSKRGSGDSKITKVLSVHIRALLPEEAQDSLTISPLVEHSAIIALGLLYLGQADRYITSAFIRELKLFSIRKDEDVAAADGRDVSIGIALGLINQDKKNLADLIPFLDTPSDTPDIPFGVSSGCMCAILLSYAGSNNKQIADNLCLPETVLDSQYYPPHTFFTRMLVRHLVMWDDVTYTREWIESQIPKCYKQSNLDDMADKDVISTLWYDYALAGILIALAMTQVSTDNQELVAILLHYIENYYLQKIDVLNASLINASNCTIHFDEYDAATTSAELVQIVSALVLAASAVSAGYGNILILRLLRKLWQIRPEYFGTYHAYPNIRFSEAHIAQAIGWLFLGGGKYALKSDKKSAGFLACFTFVDIMAGPNIDVGTWLHLKFYWSLVVEKRCIYALPNPCESVEIQIFTKPTSKTDAKVIDAKMPMLLPPLHTIEKVVINDNRYMSLEYVNTKKSNLVDGIQLIKKERPLEKLDSMLDYRLGKQHISEIANLTRRMRSVLCNIARSPETNTQDLELHLLLAFYNTWLGREDVERLLKKRDIENLKLLIWLRH